MEEYPTELEKRKLDTPEIFYVDSSRHVSKQHPPLNHARAIEDGRASPGRSPVPPDRNWDGGTLVTKREPRVTSVDSPPLKHYPRPPTYDKNQYERLKALTFPTHTR